MVEFVVKNKRIQDVDWAHGGDFDAVSMTEGEVNYPIDSLESYKAMAKALARDIADDETGDPLYNIDRDEVCQPSFMKELGDIVARKWYRVIIDKENASEPFSRTCGAEVISTVGDALGYIKADRLFRIVEKSGRKTGKKNEYRFNTKNIPIGSVFFAILPYVDTARFVNTVVDTFNDGFGAFVMLRPAFRFLKNMCTSTLTGEVIYPKDPGKLFLDVPCLLRYGEENVPAVIRFGDGQGKVAKGEDEKSVLIDSFYSSVADVEKIIPKAMYQYSELLSGKETGRNIDQLSDEEVMVLAYAFMWIFRVLKDRFEGKDIPRGYEIVSKGWYRGSSGNKVKSIDWKCFKGKRGMLGERCFDENGEMNEKGVEMYESKWKKALVIEFGSVSVGMMEKVRPVDGEEARYEAVLRGEIAGAVKE